MNIVEMQSKIKNNFMRVILSIVISALVFLTFGSVANAQFSANSPTFTPFSQYYFQQSMTNPAYVGNENQPQYWGSYQTSKEGASVGSGSGKGKAFTGLVQGRMYSAPINYGILFNYEDYFDNTVNDSTINFNSKGSFKQFQFGLQGSFDFDLGEKGIGRVGLTGALLYHDSDRIRATTTVGGTNARKFFPSLDIGIIAIYGDFEFGMSVVNSNQPNFGVQTQTSGTGGGTGQNTGNRTSTFLRAYYLNLLYDWKLNDVISLQPQTIIRIGDSVGANTVGSSQTGGGVNLSGVNIDMSLLANYYDLILLGFSYKPKLSTSQAFLYRNYWATVMAGVRIGQGYQVSFSWDLVRSEITDKSRYRKFEIGFGAFLFDGFYFEEVQEDAMRHF